MLRKYKYAVLVIVGLLTGLGFTALPSLSVHAANAFSASGSGTDHHTILHANLTAGTTYSVTFTCTDNSSTGLDSSYNSVTISSSPDLFSFSGCGSGINQSFTPTVSANFSIDLHVHTNEGSCPNTCNYNYNLSIDYTPAPPPVATSTLVPTLAIVPTVEMPTPPPVAACADTNFDKDGMVRTHFTNDADINGLNCRVLVSQTEYMNWLGGQVSFPSNIGSDTVLKLGVIGAVDVFSQFNTAGFLGDVDICLKGDGYMIYMNANQSPRVPQLWSNWKTDAYPGYTCTTLYAPGTVILVEKHP